ncbi:MAG: Fe-S cluster protein [Rubrivivax sp.]|nr:Fe-S cluster protein [Rubrivivax sp.]
MDAAAETLLAGLPGKNCGQCGFATCAGLAEYAAVHPGARARCIHLEARPAPPPEAPLRPQDIGWTDMLGREYDFILERLPEDPGPREVILPFNPGHVERLGIKRGHVLFGRPAWVGCPVTHVGLVVEEPDHLSGTITWCIVGQLAARQGSVEIGLYNPIAYEGLVRHTRAELQIGRRYFFLPRACMLQSRHSGLASALARREQGLRVRLEGIWIG